jgi:hypothetical protein
MKKLPVLVCVILALLSAVIAAIYFSKTAGALPHFFLGYTKNSDHKHIKHGVAFIGLAVAFLLGAWMVSGQNEKPKSASPDQLA